MKNMEIYNLRKQTGLSQKEFAKKFHLSAHTISGWEQGLRTPSDGVIHMIREIIRLEGENQSLQEEGLLKSEFGVDFFTRIQPVTYIRTPDSVFTLEEFSLKVRTILCYLEEPGKIPVTEAESVSGSVLRYLLDAGILARKRKQICLADREKGNRLLRLLELGTGQAEQFLAGTVMN